MLRLLSDLGVHVVELPWLEDDAVYVAACDTLLVRPGLDPETLVELADWLLMEVNAPAAARTVA